MLPCKTPAQQFCSSTNSVSKNYANDCTVIMNGTNLIWQPTQNNKLKHIVAVHQVTSVLELIEVYLESISNLYKRGNCEDMKI